MTASNVRLVFAKEMRDTLRDRRTLFISIVLPLLLYPLLMIGFSQVVIATKKGIYEKAQKVAIAPGPDAADLARKLKTKAKAKGKGKSRSFVGLDVVSSKDPAADLAAGKIDAWLEPSPGFAKAISGHGQGIVKVHFDSTRDASSAAERKVERILGAWGRQIQIERKVSPANIEPVKLVEHDRASRQQRGGKHLGPMLALFLVIMALSGAFYPAIDIMAGEKERGTMETLLVCPATRTEIVAGKYLTVFTMTVVTALLNFASMAATFSWFAKSLPQVGGGMALAISPLMGVVIVLSLLPLAGLFSAVALALSTFARTYKEGQHYLTPVFVAVMPLAMVALIPATKLSTFAAVPVAGAVLLVRDLLIGSAGVGQILVVLGTTAVFAAASIAWTVSMFNREEILFRDPGGARFTLFSRGRGEGRGAGPVEGRTPVPAQSFVLAALALVLMFFLSARLAGGRNGILFAFLVPQSLTLGLPFVAIAWYRLDLKKTLSLRLPPARGWLAAVIGAPCAFVLVLTLVSHAGLSDEALKPLEKAFEDLVSRIGLPVLLVVPPIAEETFFRGFFLSGLERRTNRWVAIVVTGAAFALFHLEPAKYLSTGLLGMWLAYLVLSTGSLYPAILAHLINNAIPFLLPQSFMGGAPSLWLLVPAGAGMMVALWLLVGGERSRGGG